MNDIERTPKSSVIENKETYNLINLYNYLMYQRYKDLRDSKSQDTLDNQDLCKIFEYYSCIQLMEEYERCFYMYDDIPPDFKEMNQMSRFDTGIDCCDMINCIVQCKLRKNTLTWGDCSTFFGSETIYDETIDENVVRWKKLILTRNSDSKLASEMIFRKKKFIDKSYNKEDLISHCEKLYQEPPLLPVTQSKIVLRDYQKECIDLINNNCQNIIISLPTGSGKGLIIFNTLNPELKYLILVPRIILMEQMKNDLIEFNPAFKHHIQTIGNGNNVYKENKNITICIFNSVDVVEPFCTQYERIFVDEAHHIRQPSVYMGNQNIEKTILNNNDKHSSKDEKEKDNEDEDSSEENEDDSEENEVDDDNNEHETKEDIENSNSNNSEELKNNKRYLEIIKNFARLNNNIYLSATIDQYDDFLYYKKDIRYMIDHGYLSDYTIHIPIFSSDPTNKNICEYLLKNYRNMIIYCNSREEGEKINEIFNALQTGSSEYIDCFTNKSNRNAILKKYNNGLLPFLVNVKILVEGYNSPRTQGVVLMHLPSANTTIVQIIGRALRLHQSKKYANIILPYSTSLDNDFINKFICTMASIDSRINKTCKDKKLGGHITVDKISSDNISINDINIEFRYELVYSSLGRAINQEPGWMKNMKELKTYFDNNNGIPNKRSKNVRFKQLAEFLSSEKGLYKKNLQSLDRKQYFEELMKLYPSRFTSKVDQWYIKFNNMKSEIDRTHNPPKARTTLGKFFDGQKRLYKNKKAIMKNNIVYDEWSKFIKDDNYIFLFLKDIDKFNYYIDKYTQYVSEHNDLPRLNSNEWKEEKMARWYNRCLGDCKNKVRLFKDIDVVNRWNNFKREVTNVYNKHWFKQLEKLENHLNDTQTILKKGSQNSENFYRFRWAQKQKTTFLNKTMDENYILAWGKFTETYLYKKYLTLI